MQQDIARLKFDGKKFHKLAIDLEIQCDRAVKSKAALQQMILLGQLAYSMTKVIHQVVYENHGPPPALSEMFDRDVLDDMSELEHARWLKLKATLKQSGQLTHMKRVDAYLRGLRNPPAHGSVSAARSTTAKQLVQWADEHCDVAWTASVKHYVEVVGRFATPGRPLDVSSERTQKAMSHAGA